MFPQGYRCAVGLFLMTVQVAAFGQSTAGGSGLQLPHLAQFQVPGVREGTPTPERPARPALPSELKFSYAWGTDSELVYRKNDDLDKRLGYHESRNKNGGAWDLHSAENFIFCFDAD